ncbi:MAG: hypothetical protein IPM16_19115, partial [Chloroflexi bacterium]|nr:hypothetical protein [Chloroflexota bacterium]
PTTRTMPADCRRDRRSFSEMAEEAAISRLYGGIHYRAAIELGPRTRALHRPVR